MRVTYDEQADAVYCYLTNREAVQTIQLSRDILVDLDRDQNVRGIGILSASRVFLAGHLAAGLLEDQPLDLSEWPLLVPPARAG